MITLKPLDTFKLSFAEITFVNLGDSNAKASELNAVPDFAYETTIRNVKSEQDKKYSFGLIVKNRMKIEPELRGMAMLALKFGIMQYAAELSGVNKENAMMQNGPHGDAYLEAVVSLALRLYDTPTFELKLSQDLIPTLKFHLGDGIMAKIVSTGEPVERGEFQILQTFGLVDKIKTIVGDIQVFGGNFTIHFWRQHNNDLFISRVTYVQLRDATMEFMEKHSDIINSLGGFKCVNIYDSRNT